MGAKRWMWRVVMLSAVTLLSGCEPDAVDADGDGSPASEDCDDASAQVWRALDAYADTDGDGFGEGAVQHLCVGDPIPSGFVRTGGDCAPGDAARWRTVSNVYRDADGDRRTQGGPQTVCVGKELTGYQPFSTEPPDCDDTDARVVQWVERYRDADGDGFGASEAEMLCVGTKEPAGYVTNATDCAPEDKARWQNLPYTQRDTDGDGWTVAQSGTVCSGSTLPAGYPSNSLGEDCNDADSARWQLRALYVDADRDGYGLGDAQTHCIGAQPEPGYSYRDRDCAPEDASRWKLLGYAYRDRDGDGETVAESDQLCTQDTLPPGYSNVKQGSDCDDWDAARMRTWEVFPDTDRDGIGAGTREVLCAGRDVPAGHSTSGNDCEPEDASRWRLLNYQYRDADGDKTTVPESGTVCSGTALPGGYASAASGLDCNDADAAVHRSLTGYEDGDGDGVGAGAAATLCTNGTLPSPYVATGTDCAPSNPALWRILAYAHVDQDRDGHTTPSSGEMCAGEALPEPYHASARGNDCDDSDAALFRWTALYADQDGDGVGAGTRTVPCLGAALPGGFSPKGYDVNDSDPSVQEDAEDDELTEFFIVH
ncbi:hypothetical protein P2318_29165 [Myxococcaceae bacterium GXIMD 01537]